MPFPLFLLSANVPDRSYISDSITPDDGADILDHVSREYEELEDCTEGLQNKPILPLQL